MNFSAADAKLEIDRRIAAKDSLLDFTTYTKPDYRIGEHHVQICEKLEAIERGDLDRLLILMFPRSGKSELASRRFPAWFLGRNPTSQVITASHGEQLARDFGIDVRNIVDSLEYQNIFPTRIATDTRAADNWRSTDGGTFYTCGIGGSVVGRGADLLIIDDPVKSRVEADSRNERDAVWKWYQGVLYPRLMKGGRILVILTHWHQDDLGGRLLDASDDWTVLKLPAVNEAGEPLWPEEFPIERLNRIKEAVDHREWASQYLQDPAPETGNFFERKWFDDRRYTDHPESLTYYVCTDFALTDTGDFTEFGVFGVDGDQKVFVLDWWSGREPADKTIDALLDLAKRYKPRVIYGETGQIRRALEPFITDRMRARGDYFYFEWINRSADKAAMASGFRAKASMGDIHFPKIEWAERVIDQLVSFPAGRYDDCVDVCALLGLSVD